MEHKFLRLFKDGVWTGREDRMITLPNGDTVNMDDYAKEHGIDLPDSSIKHTKKAKKKEINIDIEETSYEDMEESLDGGHTEVDDRGDSEG